MQFTRSHAVHAGPAPPMHCLRLQTSSGMCLTNHASAGRRRASKWSCWDLVFEHRPLRDDATIVVRRWCNWRIRRYNFEREVSARVGNYAAMSDVGRDIFQEIFTQRVRIKAPSGYRIKFKLSIKLFLPLNCHLHLQEFFWFNVLSFRVPELKQ